MNNSWGYNASDLNYKTPKTLIQQLVTAISRDGNFLLNIGPKGDGTVPDQSVSILNSFGDWMNIYSESIYGTTRSPFATQPQWGSFTKKSDKLFAHVFTWPANGLLRISSLTNSISKIYLMNDTTATLSYTDSSGCTTISLPPTAPNAINSVIVINVSGLPSASTQYIKVSAIAVGSLSGRKSAHVGDTLQMAIQITPSNAAIQSVTWSVSDTSRASISANGLLKAKKAGNVYVIATANDGTDIQGQVQLSFSRQTGIDDSQGQLLPDTPTLEQNYPNPFSAKGGSASGGNPATNISFSIPTRTFVSLKIFDVLGNEITTLFSGELSAGAYSQRWNAAGLPSGVYFYRLQADSFTKTKKLLLL
jgi:hypothetical protein